MIREGAGRTAVIREWVVDATEAIDLLEKLPMLLRDTRSARGLSLRDVERQTGVSNAVVSHMERGIGEPSMRNAIAILRWLTKVTNE